MKKKTFTLRTRLTIVYCYKKEIRKNLRMRGYARKIKFVVLVLAKQCLFGVCESVDDFRQWQICVTLLQCECRFV